VSCWAPPSTFPSSPPGHAALVPPALTATPARRPRTRLCSAWLLPAPTLDRDRSCDGDVPLPRAALGRPQPRLPRPSLGRDRDRERHTTRLCAWRAGPGARSAPAAPPPRLDASRWGLDVHAPPWGAPRAPPLPGARASAGPATAPPRPRPPRDSRTTAWPPRSRRRPRSSRRPPSPALSAAGGGELGCWRGSPPPETRCRQGAPDVQSLVGGGWPRPRRRGRRHQADLVPLLVGHGCCDGPRTCLRGGWEAADAQRVPARCALVLGAQGCVARRRRPRGHPAGAGAPPPQRVGGSCPMPSLLRRATAAPRAAAHRAQSGQDASPGSPLGHPARHLLGRSAASSPDRHEVVSPGTERRSQPNWGTARTAQAVTLCIVPRAERRARTRPTASACQACGGRAVPKSRSVSWWAHNAATRDRGRRLLRVSHTRPTTIVPTATALSGRTRGWMLLTRSSVSA
jgi:hypothetical protein